jgi:hypothetical protein
VHSGFKQLVLPLKKDYARIDEINWSPEFPVTSEFLNPLSADYDAFRPLENSDDITMKLLCSYLK